MGTEEKPPAGGNVLRWYEVPYRATYSGTCLVKAVDAAQALALVGQGEFDDAPGAERVDWESTGPAREVR